ncbi:putative transcription factor FAR family [Rosa chinensis]|uniref:Putative transcription factor FAR family n=1 Tax=Rosa chinensis TaxID=74649 RepID=A0A2P6SKE5_ROSCH|nr:putative transcription factor FAR family [Rosa chinensis]
MSDSNLQEHSLEAKNDINQLEYDGIRYDKLAPEDLIGLMFETVEAAEAFYYAYAKVVGFDVRKDDKRTSTRTGRVTIRRWGTYAKEIDKVSLPMFVQGKVLEREELVCCS